MWEKISKEMQLPWRAAEAMHWQIGEVEMAQRANVPVFHLAGHGAQGGVIPDRVPSTSPPSASSLPSGLASSHTHNHTLPQIPMTQPISVSPVQARLRRNSRDSSPIGPSQLRRRADSATSVTTAASSNRTLLPPVGDLMGPSTAARYTLPPVVTSSEALRR